LVKKNYIQELLHISLESFGCCPV